MRAVFMGSPQFSADILAELVEHVDVVAVYTQPDRVRGRGKKLTSTPVKAFAEEAGIEVRTPASLKDEAEVQALKAFAPDVVCVAAYGMILPKAVLDIPKHGCINVHASLLPRWRGAAPIERAILSGDEYAGVCIMRMEEGLDTGDYCVSRRILIKGTSSTELEKELATLGASALIVALNQIDAGVAKWTSQDDSKATYAQKIEKGELNMDPYKTVQENVNSVLASSPAHPSKAVIAGKDCTILSVQPVTDASSDYATDLGEAKDVDGHLVLGCIDGSLEVMTLKPAGKNEMAASSFLAGARLGEDATWSKA